MRLERIPAGRRVYGKSFFSVNRLADGRTVVLLGFWKVTLRGKPQS